MTGKNTATITRAIKSGKISAQKDASGAWRIEASELHRAFPLSMQDLRKPQMQSDARPLQEQKKSQMAALEQELATLRERVAAQSELLEERAGQISDLRSQISDLRSQISDLRSQISDLRSQISDLKEDRDRWRQQATSFLADLRPNTVLASKSKLRR